jgi:hypothetical protein
MHKKNGKMPSTKLGPNPNNLVCTLKNHGPFVYFFDLAQLKDLLHPMQFKPRKGAIAINTLQLTPH